MAELNLYTSMGEGAAGSLVVGNVKSELDANAGVAMRQRVHEARLLREIVPAVNEIANLLCVLYFDFDGDSETNDVHIVALRRDMRLLACLAARLLHEHYLPAGAWPVQWALTQSETSSGMHIHFTNVAFIDTRDVSSFVKLWRLHANAIGLGQLLKKPRFDLGPTMQRHLRVAGTVRPGAEDGKGNHGRHNVIAWSEGLCSHSFVATPTLLSIRPDESHLREFYENPDIVMRPRTALALWLEAPMKREVVWCLRWFQTEHAELFDRATELATWISPRCVVLHVGGPAYKEVCSCGAQDTKVSLALWNVDCHTFFWRGFCHACKTERKWQTRDDNEQRVYAYYKDDD